MDPSPDDLRRQLSAADVAYRPFAPFEVWASEHVGLGSWDDAAARLAALRRTTAVERVRDALDEVLRAAAVDTGAIEGLYRADRGFTLSVARHVVSLEQAEVEAGLGFQRSFEAQLAGFERALQLATGDEVVSEAALRELHRVTCAGQDRYRVLTPAGVQERALTLGAYKSEPNHVRLADGTFHPYAPVERVTDEVRRLVEEMRTDAFLAAPAVVQASFAHHALTAVHPFADGNGRVARLLASVWLLRSASIPLWVEMADRDGYFDALAAADQGDRQPFLRLVTSISLRLLRELAVVLEAPPGPSRDQCAEAAVAVASDLGDIVEEATGADGGAQVIRPGIVPTRLPAGVQVPGPAATVAFNTEGSAFGVGARFLAVGIAEEAEAPERFRILVYGGSWDGELLAQHPFEHDELVPAPTPAARRRLEHIVRGVADGSRLAHRALRDGRAESAGADRGPDHRQPSDG